MADTDGKDASMSKKRNGIERKKDGRRGLRGAKGEGGRKEGGSSAWDSVPATEEALRGIVEINGPFEVFP